MQRQKDEQGALEKQETRTTYNGILHYETWCISHWIDANAAVRSHWMRLAAEIHAQCASVGDPVTKLSELLEQWHVDKIPNCGGVYADLIKATLRRVNWADVAVELLAKL